MLQTPSFETAAAAMAMASTAERCELTWSAASAVASRIGTARALLLFVFVSNAAVAQDGTAQIDVKTIAARVGLPIRAVDGLLNQLVAAGFLAVRRKGKLRRVAFPFMAARHCTVGGPSALRRPVAAVAATSCMQH